MNSFFRKTGVKVAGSILCIVFLTAGVFFGLLTLLLVQSGSYEGGSLFSTLADTRMSNDAASIMYDYFDASDPEHPWVSYHSGGIYTGEDSNFLYDVTDDETGKSVLSTYDGEDADVTRSYRYSFQTEETTPVADRYAVTSKFFECDGTYYLYNSSLDCFEQVSHDLADAVGTAQLLAEGAVDEGFSYGDNHYTYDGDSFQLDETWDSSDTTYVSHGYTITCCLRQGLPYQDGYRTLAGISDDLTGARDWLIVLTALCLALGIALLAMLGCSVGRVNGKDEPVLSPIHRIPMDVAVIVLFFLCGSCGSVLLSPFESPQFQLALLLDGVVLLFFVASAVYLIVTLCAKVKTHTLLHGTLIFWLLRHLGRLLRALGRGIRRAVRCLPLIWQVMAGYGVLCLLELIGLVILSPMLSGSLIFVWLIEKLLLGILVGYVTMCFLRLRRGAEQIAAGNYSAKVEEAHLVLDFKDTADTLNHIQDGMTAAVESRMKSERLKTELITNVSHDLKTPLTSIVSYVDLLRQEPAGSEAAKEYLEVLDRQSARLKKLVEDLVEASKASTGNIPVQAEPMDVSVLLGQALGEYSQRLEAAGLTPVLHVPEAPAMVKADGRLLWRVFDNLLGNAVKYAMPGTRVYLTVVAGETITAVFRNISKEPLDVSADELLERFVRGDASRHTEGSGLGLSIAKSLTDSMGGTFCLSVDGDLFKAEVSFPALPPEPEAEPEA